MATKYERTHQTLINQGMKLFAEKGFDNVTVMDICADTLIARPTFYLHFKSKEQLVTEYYESNIFFSPEMEKWVRQPYNPWDSIIRIMTLLIQNTCNLEQVDMISRYLSYRLTNGNTAELTEFNTGLESTLLDLIKDAQSSNIIQNDSDPYYLCQTISMLQMGNLFKWCSYQGKFDQFVNFFWNLEAALEVQDAFKGRWKLQENYYMY